MHKNSNEVVIKRLVCPNHHGHSCEVEYYEWNTISKNFSFVSTSCNEKDLNSTVKKALKLALLNSKKKGQ